MKPNTIEPMPKTEAERKAYEHYRRVYLGENGGPTKMEILCDLLGGIVIFAGVIVFCYILCAL